MKIAIAQINTSVGDIAGNTKKILLCIKNARQKKADIVVFPEMTITGYPTQDLLFKKDFLEENKKALNNIVSQTKGICAIVGFVDYDVSSVANSNGESIKRYNSAAIIKDGKILYIQRKMVLPNYDVFVEYRYFTPGTEQKVLNLFGKKVGVLICEDLWASGPSQKLKKLGAQIIITISASPFHVGKIGMRKKLLLDRAKETKATQIYVNQFGGQDELIFDGRSMIVDRDMSCKACLGFCEELQVCDLENNSTVCANADPIKETYSALVLGIKDYFQKNNFKKAVVGASGGIDSSLVLCLATEALGKENVIAVAMPSPYTSDASKEDAKYLANRLGIRHMEIPITTAMKTFSSILSGAFAKTKQDTTEENIQARIRGNILMALSNKFGWLVLSTGNKSEISVGYCTLYGDLTGGLGVISDVLKTTVYKLAEYCNEKYLVDTGTEVIPRRVLTRAPSAELRQGQKDSDSLPDYTVLDKILHLYIDRLCSSEQIIKKCKDINGFDKKTVEKIIRLVDLAEYKRKQMPPGLKITPKAFGSGRRMPITSGWK